MSEKQINAEIGKIIEGIDKLNLGQVSELIEEIKTKYNIQETAVIQPGNSVQTNTDDVQTSSNNVSVVFVEISEGSNKVQIYSLVRNHIKELTGKEINVIEASKLTKEKGQVILENIPREKAELFKKQLEEKGAKVEIK